ncbi:ABC transporter permease [Streptomyces antibioticus]|uniref:ABC transporter permease n=1 Tax=Streptomyces antibioticus TaxID=1890 RepID=UPI0033A45B02
MKAFILRRTGSAIVVVLGVVVLTFMIARVIPGDPASAWAGPKATPASVEAISRQLGLDQPVPVQIWTFFSGVLSGDWGTSIHTHQPVLDDILNCLPASLELVVAGLTLALIIGVPLGLISARWRGRWVDHLVRAISVLGVSMPAFWLALILRQVFFQKLHWLPVAGEYDPDLQYSSPLAKVTGAAIPDALLSGNWPVLGSALAHTTLPAVVVGSYATGVIARMVRANVLEVAGETHTQMVRSLGFSERAVFGRFALRLAWSPVLQVVALVFAYSLVNTFLVESVFNWPGLGSYAAQSISSLDTPAITGLTLLIAFVYVVVNALVDVAQALLDPRVGLR